MPFETLKYSVENATALITLFRADKLNSINTKMVRELHLAMDSAENDERVRVILLRGAGRAFCSGFDLEEMDNDATVEEIKQVLTVDFNIIMRFWNSPKPTMSVVNGFTLGGGFELAMACDVTIASHDAVFGEPEPKFGSGIVALLLPWLTGPKQAKDMLLFGNDRVNAKQAYEMGLVNKIVPFADLDDVAKEMAYKCARLDACAVRYTKLAINRSYGEMGLEGALRQALDLDVIIETTDTEGSMQFKSILAQEGIKAAIAWREAKSGLSFANGNGSNQNEQETLMTFKALLVDKQDDIMSQNIERLEDVRLPHGDVTVAVEYSTVNYKDGLTLSGQGGLVRNYPHVPGIDFAGTVEHSDDPRYKAGDKVVLTGWRVGEVCWGGYATRTRVKADYLVPLPEGLSTRNAMAVGTAGLSAMLAVMALEDHGLVPDNGDVLVTGAGGGVGSIASLILSNKGYQVTAVTGRSELGDYLHDLGVTSIIAREDIAAPVKRPLEPEQWAGCIDAVGGGMLARILGQMQYGSSIAVVGLAGGVALPATLIPFLLRGINLLGISSVMQPYENRLKAWDRIVRDLPFETLEKTITTIALTEVVERGKAILKGEVKGRTVVDLNA